MRNKSNIGIGVLIACIVSIGIVAGGPYVLLYADEHNEDKKEQQQKKAGIGVEITQHVTIESAVESTDSNDSGEEDEKDENDTSKNKASRTTATTTPSTSSTPPPTRSDTRTDSNGNSGSSSSATSASTLRTQDAEHNVSSPSHTSTSTAVIGSVTPPPSQAEFTPFTSPNIYAPVTLSHTITRTLTLTALVAGILGILLASGGLQTIRHHTISASGYIRQKLQFER
jgi:cytoskeletal protein RodZ